MIFFYLNDHWKKKSYDVEFILTVISIDMAYEERDKLFKRFKRLEKNQTPSSKNVA